MGDLNDSVHVAVPSNGQVRSPVIDTDLIEEAFDESMQKKLDTPITGAKKNGDYRISITVTEADMDAVDDDDDDDLSEDVISDLKSNESGSNFELSPVPE